VVAAAAQGGARWFIFREKNLDLAPRRSLAMDCLEIARAAGARMAVASDTHLAAELGISVHLAAADPLPPDGLGWGRSCHRVEEIARAAADGAAYATVSPVFSSAAKPGYGPALEQDGLHRLVESAHGVPLYALGGVTALNAEACMEAGAAGVAVMSAVMTASDPAGAAGRILQALSGTRAG